MQRKLITPSILNVKKNMREEIILTLLKLGIKWFHFDVMDSQFVPNEAISVEEIIAFYNHLPKHLSDVHLMVKNPIDYARKLRNFTTCITVHYESFNSEKEIIDFVNEFSKTNWIGISIKPKTEFKKIKHLLYLFDIVLVMSVEPGFGGQKFIENTFDKIKEIKKFIDEEKLPTLIQVDGGINESNSKLLFELGTSFNVVGSYLINSLNKETMKKISY